MNSPHQATEIAARDQTVDETTLTQIEGYEIQGVLGRGGMGVVYRATDNRLGRPVALKTIHLARNTPQNRQRFETEARSLAQIQHPGVVQIYEVGLSGNTPYLAMELVPGPGLDVFTDGQPMEPEVAARIVMSLAQTLHSCHEQGIIHRDLKPGNVLMPDVENPKVTDFGLAKLLDSEHQITQTGDVMGTPGYMAPEQASGVVRNIGPSVDIYGLGAILYDLVTGHPPFSSPDPVQTMMMVLTDPPIPPRVLQPRLPADLETIILKCLEKKKAHRYQTAAELADDLQRFTSGQPISARPTPFYRKAAMWVSRHPVLSTALVLMALLIAGVIGGISWHNVQLQTSLDRSERIIKEARQMNQWLLNDFCRILQTNRGITYVQSRLVNRTQAYMDSLVKEATNDEELKIELAQAFLQLAHLQGQPDYSSLGEFENAQLNLGRAEQMIESLDETESIAARRVLFTTNLHRAAFARADNQFDKAGEHAVRARELLTEMQESISAEHYMGYTVELETFEFTLANSLGQDDKAQAALDQLKMTSDQIQADPGIDPRVRAMALMMWLRQRSLWMEQKKLYDESVEELEEGREQLVSVLEQTEMLIEDRTMLASIDTDLANAWYRREQMDQALEKYQSALATWQELYDRDRENHIAMSNMAYQWHSIGDVYNFLAPIPPNADNPMMSFDEEKLAQAEAAYEKAKRYFLMASEQADENETYETDYLYLHDSLARLFIFQGRADDAREACRTKIDGLHAMADQNHNHRRAIGDTMMTLALIDWTEYGDAMNFEGETVPDSYYQAFQRARKSWQDAIDYIEQAVEDGVQPEATQTQLDMARESIGELDTAHRRLLELYSAEDF
ncbi:MAG: protein kinase domain-containing protein [Pirellulaceae bacterium]